MLFISVQTGKFKFLFIYFRMVCIYKRKTSWYDLSPDLILAAAKTAIEEGKITRPEAESVGVSPIALCRYIVKVKESGYENIEVGYDISSKYSHHNKEQYQ